MRERDRNCYRFKTLSSKSPRKLWRRCLYVLTAIGLLALGKAYLVENTAAKQKPDAVLVNISGRQRMLSQRINSLAHETARALRLKEEEEAINWHSELIDTLAEFKTYHHAVSSRSYEYGFSGEHTQFVQSKFQEISSDFEHVVLLTEDLLKRTSASFETGTFDGHLDDDLRELTPSCYSYLEKMNVIVQLIENNARVNLEQTRLAAWYGLFGTVVLLLIEAFLVLRPAVRHVQIQHEDLLEMNQTLQNALEETDTINAWLREAVDLNDAIFETAADGLLLLDQDLSVIRANARASEMLEIDFNGDSQITICDLLWESNGVENWNAFEELITSSSDHFICNSQPVKLKRGDSDSFHAELSLSRVGKSNSNHFTAIIRDTTERDMLQGQLRQSEKMASVGRLSASVAHEINSPMQCIALNVQYISTTIDGLLLTKRECLDDSPEMTPLLKSARNNPSVKPTNTELDRVLETVSTALEDVSSASDQVAKIVKAMKSLSHPDSSDLKEVYINDLVQDAVSLSKNTWKHAAELSLELAPGLPRIELVAVAISQGIINLINNASDAIVMKHGIKSAAGKIIISTRLEGETIIVSVKDNGPGIPHDIREYVFEQFFTTKDVGEGTGLGLAFCYDTVVHGHRGNIRFESEPDQGTTFFLELPIRVTSEKPKLELVETI